MLTANRTLAVNAAFLQEIKDDDHQLREYWRLAREAAQRPCEGARQIRRLAEAAAALRDQLALHFSLEEAYGYFTDAVQAAPWLGAKAGQLREQHVGLYCELCEATEKAEDLVLGKADFGVGEVIAQLQRFFERLEAHEAEEYRLISAAFEEDIGVGD